MATAFTRRKRIDPLEGTHKLGWCVGPPGAALQHQPLGPDEKPVIPLDVDGNRITGFCPGSVVTSREMARIPKGTITYCQCPCHGEDLPEAYPGYFAYRAGLAGIQAAEAGEETADAPESDDPVSAEVPLLGVVSPEIIEEPPLPQLGNPSEEESEALEDAPVSAQVIPWTDDGVQRAEVKDFTYPNGIVTKTERQSVTRNGNEVTLTEWIAKLPDGTKIGAPRWSRKAAKELLP